MYILTAVGATYYWLLIPYINVMEIHLFLVTTVLGNCFNYCTELFFTPQFMPIIGSFYSGFVHSCSSWLTQFFVVNDYAFSKISITKLVFFDELKMTANPNCDYLVIKKNEEKFNNSNYV